MLPESNSPSSEVTLWGELEAFVQCTLPPALTVMEEGSKLESVIRTSFAAGETDWARLAGDPPAGPNTPATTMTRNEASARAGALVTTRRLVLPTCCRSPGNVCALWRE